MKKYILTTAFAALCLAGGAVQNSSYAQERSLQDYISAAKKNSPLINDLRNLGDIQEAELNRLKAAYKMSRLELNGEWLFVPVISREGGRTSFRWNDRDGADYYGYDLGESSGHLHAGLTWTQPLLGGSSYKTVREQYGIERDAAELNIRLEEHQLERVVTEHYLLCLLDQIQMQFADSVAAVITRQTDIVRKLAGHGLARESDLRLLDIEAEANKGQKAAAEQSLRTHLLDLDILCGLSGTSGARLREADIEIDPQQFEGQSIFTEQYRLDSLRNENSLKLFSLQYKPRLDIFMNTGLQAGSFAQMYRHFGFSAGLTFSMTIFDGRQKHWKERQFRLRQNTASAYMKNAELQRKLRLGQCLSEIEKFDERAELLEREISEYENVLSMYEKEISAGQISVLEYITVLRSRIQREQEYMLLKTNRMLVVAAYNYWNK